MCAICGCGDGGKTADPHDHEHEHVLPDGSVVRHAHGHEHEHVDQRRLIAVEQDILAKNDGFAAVNRLLFAAKGVFAVNLMSSPGSGKTTLLVETLKALQIDGPPCAVIEGDQQTSADADRIRAVGAPALQINTGKGCHLDAQMIALAAGRLNVADRSVLFIENVGNLVCPAGFDLGENARVVVLSVTEGEDKPLKYPDMFASADFLAITKADLLPYLDFDVAALLDNARQIKPGLPALLISAKTGQGMAEWLDWINAAAQSAARRG